MSSTFTTVTFYIAPSKERHPLVSQLFLCENPYHAKKPRVVTRVTRVEGFLTGEFSLCDGNRYEEEYSEDEGEEYSETHSAAMRERYEGKKKFFDLYRQLGTLGYLSEDYRTSWWSGNGDNGSEWVVNFNVEDRFEHQVFLRKEQRRKLKHFWEEFPNLMYIMKYALST